MACSRAALGRAPKHVGARLLKALSEMDAHEFAAARATARGVIRDVPTHARAWGILSDALLELGERRAATAAVQRMLDLKPGLPAYARAAHLRYLEGDVEGAKALYRAAMRVGQHSTDPEPLAWVTVEAARLFLVEGDLQGAQAGFELALRYRPGYAPALAGRRAVVAAQAGEGVQHGHGGHGHGHGHGHVGAARPAATHAHW